MLIGNGFYIFSFAEVQKFHSRFACHILPHEDVKYVYMQELNVVMLYAVIFVPIVNFWYIASVTSYCGASQAYGKKLTHDKKAFVR